MSFLIRARLRKFATGYPPRATHGPAKSIVAALTDITLGRNVDRAIGWLQVNLTWARDAGGEREETEQEEAGA